ncbi:hypothetical protein KQI86_05465 [Clostridium sp. MSJ-11]|uniref:Uncharacterized protein n=1 Tax=Clostridium mobile TaxID=2841512 RepID=A0ABS6EEY1_9CLOT|nr:hypothetical protein [Clostridium mobile]MBU5483771.1 hypothetical protein [Clostridium mobile]
MGKKFKFNKNIFVEILVAFVFISIMFLVRRIENIRVLISLSILYVIAILLKTLKDIIDKKYKVFSTEAISGFATIISLCILIYCAIKIQKGVSVNEYLKLSRIELIGISLMSVPVILHIFKLSDS